MTIARYKRLDGHPVFKYSVELLVQTNGKLIKIAELNCKDEQEVQRLRTQSSVLRRQLNEHRNEKTSGKMEKTKQNN